MESKKPMWMRGLLVAGIAGAGLLVAPSSGPLKAPVCEAAMMTYNVNFSSLGSLAGKTNYQMDYSLIPSSSATTNSSTTLNFGSFNYGSGGTGPTSAPSLTDSQTFNENLVNFTPGSSLSFLLTANYTPEGANPDVFSFGFFNTTTTDNTATATAPTVGSATGDGISYFTLTFSGATPTINTYAGTNPAFAAPTVTAVATPEPQTWAMMALGVLALGLIERRRRQGSSSENSFGNLPPGLA